MPKPESSITAQHVPHATGVPEFPTQQRRGGTLGRNTPGAIDANPLAPHGAGDEPIGFTAPTLKNSPHPHTSRRAPVTDTTPRSIRASASDQSSQASAGDAVPYDEPRRAGGNPADQVGARGPEQTAAGGGPGDPPDKGGPPPGAEFPGEPMSEGEILDRLFDGSTSTPPTAKERTRLQETEAAVNWLGYVSTRSPVAVAFGAENAEADSERSRAEFLNEPTRALPPRLKPEQADEIVERQLRSFSDTLTRVQEGATRASDLADLTAAHAGRTLVEKRSLGYPSDYPSTSYIERFSISLAPDDSTLPSQPVRFGVPHPSGTFHLAVEALSPATNKQYELIRHDTPDGGVHLTQRDLERRYSARVTDGRLHVEVENAYSVREGDTKYFRQLSADLQRYESTLLQVAEHAGFRRDNMINSQTGRPDRDFLNERVDPVIASEAFQQGLPPALRGELMRQTHSLAQRVNPTYVTPESIVQFGFRLGGYFRTALGRQDS